MAPRNDHPDRLAFFTFLQERWPIFLDRLAKQDSSGVHEEKKTYGFEFSGPLDLPFDHDDVRVYIDNLFLEGFLEAVPHKQAESLSKSWLTIGIRTDEHADQERRVDGLLDALASDIPKADTRHDDWLHFAKPGPSWLLWLWIRMRCCRSQRVRRWRGYKLQSMLRLSLG